MKKFLVGGAVRDMLMGVTPKDHDYVVVGSTVEEMLANGFTQVGADFPVFLKDDEEYALARREKKTGVGYLGFESEFGVDVTLEEDLGRRDLTINSMAIKVYGEFGTTPASIVHDPFNGQEDLHNKVLRHTSNAFEEDSVRVLRLARFRARFGAEWSVAIETKNLVHDMAKKGVLGELQAERVWKELSRALMEPFPRLFFDTLLECDALHVLFPEVYSLCSAMESRKWHPEGNAYEHTMLVLTQSALHDYDLESRLAALVHDFGKGLTRKENFPRHYGHDVNGVPVVENFCNRLTVPTKMRDRAMKATRYHMYGHSIQQLTAKTWLNMFESMSVKNDPTSLEVLYNVFVCDRRGRLGSESDDISNLNYVKEKYKAFANVKFSDVFPNGETNPEKIKQGLKKAYIIALTEKT